MGVCLPSTCRGRRCPYPSIHNDPVVTSGITSLAAALIVLLASDGFAQTGTTAGTRPPDFTVQIWGDAVADFSARLRNYAELRGRLEPGLPPLAVTLDPANILRAEFALARRLRHERKGIRRGNIFSPEISAAFRAVLLPELDAETIDTILEENPGEFRHQVDGTYPKERPLSTVPANVLRILPELPADIQYRFLGRHLVLHDTRANIIVDRMTCAIPCHR